MYPDRPPQRITETVAYPLGWNEDGTIFFIDDGVEGSGATHIHAIPSTGGEPQTWMDLPFNCGFSNLTLSNDGRRAVCAVNDAVSDVWLVDQVAGLR